MGSTASQEQGENWASSAGGTLKLFCPDEAALPQGWVISDGLPFILAPVFI